MCIISTAHAHVIKHIRKTTVRFCIEHSSHIIRILFCKSVHCALNTMFGRLLLRDNARMHTVGFDMHGLAKRHLLGLQQYARPYQFYRPCTLRLSLDG